MLSRKVFQFNQDLPADTSLKLQITRQEKLPNQEAIPLPIFINWQKHTFLKYGSCKCLE